MVDRVIYPIEGGVAVITPTGELSIEQVALKDVPAGVPFRLIDQGDLPSRETRENWSFDFSSPDGFGLGPDEWRRRQR